MQFITLTRKMGTGGTEIARRVAKQLQYSFYDTEAIENTAQEMGFFGDVKQMDEKVPSLFERYFTRRPEIRLDRFDSVIYELASRGNAVFLGRGSHILLRTFKCAFHVRVTASMETRLRNMVERGINIDVAQTAIHKSDRERGDFVRFAFGLDWDNPELYDMVLNMDHLTLDLATDTVLHMARTEEIMARSIDAMKSLQMMGLDRRAEAALIEAGGFPLVSVSAMEPDRVQLTGSVPTEQVKTKAVEILKRVKGVASVDNRLEVTELPRISY